LQNLTTIDEYLMRAQESECNNYQQLCGLQLNRRRLHNDSHSNGWAKTWDV